MSESKPMASCPDPVTLTGLTVTVDDLASVLARLDRDHLLALIETVDSEVAEWSFTFELLALVIELADVFSRETADDDLADQLATLRRTVQGLLDGSLVSD